MLELSFRAPLDEDIGLNGALSYEMSVRGPSRSCLRQAFPHAENERGRSIGVLGFQAFGSVLVNGRPVGHRLIHTGEIVVMRFRAPACPGVYRGMVTHVDEREDAPTVRTRIGSFTLQVTGEGVLASTGLDLRLIGLAGALLAFVGFSVRWLARTHAPIPAGGDC
jgi:hypothetical protein